MPATAPATIVATPVAAMAAPTVRQACHRQPFHLWEPACRRRHPPLLPRLLSLPWQLPHRASAAIASPAPSPAMPSVGAGMPATAPSTPAASPVAAMAAPTVRQSGHRQPFHLWEPACRRRHPPLVPRLPSLPWQLPQRASAAMASPAPSPAMRSVGAGMPATAPSTSAATPVAAMAAPTQGKCCHRQPCAISGHAICGSRHAGDGTLGYCCDSGRWHGRSHRKKVLPSPAMPSGVAPTAAITRVAAPVRARRIRRSPRTRGCGSGCRPGRACRRGRSSARTGRRAPAGLPSAWCCW